MPVIKSAIKKLRTDKKKQLGNDLYRQKLDIQLRKAIKSKKKEDIVASISIIDKAARKFVIHKNKAARLKSQLSHLLPVEKKAVTSAMQVKTPIKKTSTKAA